MSDVKDDIDHVKAEIGKLSAEEAAAVTWVKAHWVVIGIAGAFILGWATRFIHL